MERHRRDQKKLERKSQRERYQRHDGATSVAKPEQLRLPHSAPKQPRQAPEQTRQLDNAIASTGADDAKLEGLDNHQGVVSCVTKLKQLRIVQIYLNDSVVVQLS